VSLDSFCSFGSFDSFSFLLVSLTFDFFATFNSACFRSHEPRKSTSVNTSLLPLDTSECTLFPLFDSSSDEAKIELVVDISDLRSSRSVGGEIVWVLFNLRADPNDSDRCLPPVGGSPSDDGEGDGDDGEGEGGSICPDLRGVVSDPVRVWWTEEVRSRTTMRPPGSLGAACGSLVVPSFGVMLIEREALRSSS